MKTLFFSKKPPPPPTDRVTAPKFTFFLRVKGTVARGEGKFVNKILIEVCASLRGVKNLRCYLVKVWKNLFKFT
jgi:hypothetical protein